jgi:hypothetical protein
MASLKVTGYIPNEIINVNAVRMELLNALRAEGREIRQDLQKTTKTWKHRVKFEMKVSLRRTSGSGYVEVWTDDEIYGYVNNGTPPHLMGPILPVRKKVLKIPTGGTRPKTRPGVMRSYKGGSKGPYIFAKKTKMFTHPGSEPRDFTVTIRNKIYKSGRFQKRIDEAVSRGIARADKAKKKVG